MDRDRYIEFLMTVTKAMVGRFIRDKMATLASTPVVSSLSPTPLLKTRILQSWRIYIIASTHISLGD